MKKISLNFLVFCLLHFSLSAQFQLPSSNFETGWVNKNGINGPYLEFQTDYFYTLNSLFAEENSQGPGDITAWRDGNPQEGMYCIKLVSGVIPVGEDVFLPGLVGTINEQFVKEFIDSGNEGITMYRDWYGYETPHALEGWYKYNPVNGDSALIDIAFYNNQKEVFVEKMMIYNSVNEWTKFTVKIPEKYWNEWFEDIRVLFVASAGVNFVHLMECKGQKGSTLWIDNISLNYEDVGIKQNLLSTLKANAFPNPAIEVLNIELNEQFAGTISVFNITGSKVMEEDITGTQCQLSISNLSSGNYIYKLMNGNTIFAQGKFVVTK